MEARILGAPASREKLKYERGRGGLAIIRSRPDLSRQGVRMPARATVGRFLASGAAAAVIVAAAALSPYVVSRKQVVGQSEVPFTRDIAPILQRSCQNCHRPDGVAPMSLVSYEDVRPWARAIKQRTSIGPRAGVMPPWYGEKKIGIQHYKDDPSLGDEEIAKIAKWTDDGAPQGDPAAM